LLKDDDSRRGITENCYAELIESGKYSYKSFIKEFDRQLFSEGFSPEVRNAEAEKVTELLNRDKFERYMRVRFAKLRHRPFPGRNVLKPFMKPVLKCLGI
jgi:hypothetical protein